MKIGCDSKVACWTTMEPKQRGNKQKDYKLNEPFSKVFSSCSSSISMISCLSKVASLKSYTIAPYSPEYSHRAKSNGSRSHSGPIISIIPKEARRMRKGGPGFESLEPTSPKVSCIGQVKLKAKGTHKDKGRSGVRPPLPLKELGRIMKLSKLFLGKLQREKSDEGKDCSWLGQMRQFPSRRESPALANFHADLVDEKDENEREFGVFSEEIEKCDVNLASVIRELKSRTNSEIVLWEQSRVICDQIPLPELT